MPELPEVETVVRDLGPVLLGRVFQEVKIYWTPSVTGDWQGFVAALVGRTAAAIFRRGKYVCIELDDGMRFTVHLRMSGRLVYCLEPRDKKHLRVEFLLTGGCGLYFIDTRKFGRMKLWPPGQVLLPALGPEPLDPGVLWQVLKNLTSRRAVKTVLLDQHVLAGVGNIYADEALAAAGINPATPANRVAKTRLKRLARELPRILGEAVANKGTTLADYRVPAGGEGGNRPFLKVYGREGQPCFQCGGPIERVKINGRSSSFCPRCQKPRRKIKGTP